MRPRLLALLSAILLSAAGGQQQQEPSHLYGIHDPGGEEFMLKAGTPGWIVFTEELGADPNARGGRDYTPWTSRGLGALVRLNFGYHPRGTLPREKDYDNFAKRCANFAADSKGARHWIVGNETNLRVEWPQEGGNPEPITAQRYISCYKKVRAAIRSLPGHKNDVVITSAPGAWNYDTDDWLKYFAEILQGLGTGVDGIALHTYTPRHDPALITSDEKKKDRYVHFRAYIDYMNAIPRSLRRKPVYITETDAGEAWKNVNNGWVKTAYAEIRRWNRQRGSQKIRALCLYRWPALDKWVIEDKPEVIRDFEEAMKMKYRWDR